MFHSKLIGDHSYTLNELEKLRIEYVRVEEKDLNQHRFRNKEDNRLVLFKKTADGKFKYYLG
jgi:hypothetical protein